MRNKRRTEAKSSRRAATVVLMALMIVFLAGMVAFGVDVGFIVLVKTQLQTAADSSAMAAAIVMGKNPNGVYDEAKKYAAKHDAGGVPVDLTTTDVEFGTWDTTTRTFTPSSDPTIVGNAVRVTARRPNAPMFFGRVFGAGNFSTQASAVAMANPRDIAFVVDLSGSMNDDTDAVWATSTIDSEFATEAPNAGTNLMSKVYEDFNFGAFPGPLHYLGTGLSGVGTSSSAYENMTDNGGPLTLSTIASDFRISSGDSESTRKQKAYSWIMENQIKVIMPNAVPPPNYSDSDSLAYWSKYLDYLILTSSRDGNTVPPYVNNSRRIDDFNNPNRANYPSASTSLPRAFRNYIGYQTYVSFMMDWGRDGKPVSGQYTPLSTQSPYCPFHSESTDGGTFSFPPREQPTHSGRRALIAAMQVVKSKNDVIPDVDQRDWVSVISFDKKNSGTVLHQALTGNYSDAMQACTQLQAVSDIGASTTTDIGLISAQTHLKPASDGDGGSGRKGADKVVVLMTDGVANQYVTPGGTISTYMSTNPNSNFYGSNNNLNSPLMQADMMQVAGTTLFPVGVGLGTDYNFMDRMARINDNADDNGQSPRGSGNPAEYEQRLKDIFTQIINTPKVRLVQ